MQLFRKKKTQKNDLYITYLPQHISFQLRTISPAPGEEKRRGGRVFSSSPWWSVTCWLLGDWPSKPWILGSERVGPKETDILWPKKQVPILRELFRDFVSFGGTVDDFEGFSETDFLVLGEQLKETIDWDRGFQFFRNQASKWAQTFSIDTLESMSFPFCSLFGEVYMCFFLSVFYLSNLVRYVRYHPKNTLQQYFLKGILYWTSSVPWF